MKKENYRAIVLVTGTLGISAALGLGRFGYSAVLPSMQQSLSLVNTQAGFMATANLVGYLLMSVIGGALASYFGPRLIISIGLAVASIAMILTGYSPDFTQAALWRFITGLGSGAANVGIMGLWSSWFDRGSRGTAAGVAVAGSSLALMALGPTVPAIIASGGPSAWRTCWLLFGAAAAVITCVNALLIRNKPVDSASAVAGRESGSSWRSIYRAWPVWHLGFVYMAFGFSYIIYMTFFVKYLVSGHSYSSQRAGTLFMVMGFFSIFCGVLWGTVSDRIGRKGALILVYIIQIASYLLFTVHLPLAVVVSSVLFGITAWSIPAIMAAACGDVLGPRMAPAGLGFITLFFGIGQALAPSVAGAMADRFGSFGPSFLLASVVSCAGIAGAVLLRAAVPAVKTTAVGVATAVGSFSDS